MDKSDDNGPQVITRNERIFAVPFSRVKTKMGADSITTTTGGGLDITVLESSLANVGIILADAYNRLVDYLDEAEAAFQLKFLNDNVQGANTPDNLMSIYNKLSATIPRVQRGRQHLALWYKNVQNDLYDLNDMVSRYNLSYSQLASLEGVDGVYGIGFELSIDAKAAKKLRKLKSLQRLGNTLSTLNVRIQNATRNFQQKLNELDTGVLHYNQQRDIVNVKELIQTIIDINGGESPLQQVRTALSQIIWEKQYDFNIVGNQPPMLQVTVPDLSAAKILNTADILRRLKDYNDHVIYNENMAPILENIRAYATKYLANDITNFNQIQALTDSWEQNNTPDLFIARLAEEIRTAGDNADKLFKINDRLNKTLALLPTNAPEYQNLKGVSIALQNKIVGSVDEQPVNNDENENLSDEMEVTVIDNPAAIKIETTQPIPGTSTAGTIIQLPQSTDLQTGAAPKRGLGRDEVNAKVARTV